VEVLTREARSILKKDISLTGHIEQSGNLGGLIVGLHTGNYDLIRRSLKDVTIEPQRASLIPHFYDVQDSVLKNGALGCSISGAGPSIFALCDNSFIAENVGAAMKKVFADRKIESSLFISPINLEGAIKY